MLETKGRTEYVTNRAWFQEALKGEDVILKGTSALEHLQLFVGYLNEKTIEVYAKKKGAYNNILYHVVDSFEDIDFVEIDGIKCSSLNQCVNDMINDWDNADAQALTEALSSYYYSNNKSFDGIVATSNPEILEEVKEWAVQYYVHTDTQ